MPSHIIDYELFGDQFSTPEIRAIFEERAMLQRWLAADLRVKGVLTTSELAALMHARRLNG